MRRIFATCLRLMSAAAVFASVPVAGSAVMAASLVHMEANVDAD